MATVEVNGVVIEWCRGAAVLAMAFVRGPDPRMR
jgi:hypothetical protein